MAEKKTEITLNAASDPEIKGGAFSFSSEPITCGADQVTIDEMPAYYYRGARYKISVVDENNNVELSEWVLLHDNVNINLTNLNTVNNLTMGYVGTFTGRLVRGQLQLLFQGNSVRHILRFSKEPIKADSASPVSIWDQLADGSYSQEGSGGIGPGSTPMTRLYQDTEPGLGGNLNLNNYSIVGDHITLNPVTNVIVDGSIVPSTTTAFDLGSASKEWNNLYVEQLRLGSARVVWDNTSSRLAITDNSATYPIPKLLQDLSNVSTTTPTIGQGLLWSGTSWAPASVSRLAFPNVQILGGSLVEAVSATDTLTIEAGQGIAITSNPSSRKITLSTIVVDTNTTYSTGLTSVSSSVDYNLVASDNNSDYIRFSPGSGIAISKVGTKEIQIRAVQVADLQIVTNNGGLTDNDINITSITTSTSPTTGALTVSGGVGIGENLNVTGSANIGGNVVITGDLTVNGDVTTVNTSTVTVEDINIELGKVAVPTNVTANGGGIVLKGTTDKSITWASSNSAWTSTEHINLATGKQFYINNQSVLSSTTLGSTVTASSLTSVGTLVGLSSSGIVNISNGTASTASNNGALVVSGGVGIGGAVNVAGLLSLGGGLSINGPIDLSNNSLTVGPLSEKIYRISNAQYIMTHNWAQYTIFYHSTPAGSFTADFINVPATVDRTVSAILVIEQGSTPYIATSVMINSQAQTIKWQTGSAPIGTANGVDVITFSMIRNNTSWVVLGQLVSFG